MTNLNTGITIDAEYVGGDRPAERTPTTTFRVLLPSVPGETVPPIQPESTPRGSTASVLQASLYLEDVATGPSDAILTTRAMGSDPAEQARSARNAAVIALLEKWLADDTSYDEDTWPALQQRIEESRPSRRRRFSE